MYFNWFFRDIFAYYGEFENGYPDAKLSEIADELEESLHPGNPGLLPEIFASIC